MVSIQERFIINVRYVDLAKNLFWPTIEKTP